MIRNLDWMDAAGCVGQDPELFFPESDQSQGKAAKAICASCPVQLQCADFAAHLEQGAGHTSRTGLWGGLTPHARTRLDRNAGVPNKRQQSRADREADIIRLHQAGWETADIAEHIGCSSRTVWRFTQRYRDQLEEAA